MNRFLVPATFIWLIFRRSEACRAADALVVLQNDKGNQASPNVVVVPLTSAIKKTGQPTHVLLCASETGLKEDSIALCENPQTVPKQILSTKLTTIPKRDMKRIAESYLLASATLSYFTPKELSAIWKIRWKSIFTT